MNQWMFSVIQLRTEEASWIKGMLNFLKPKFTNRLILGKETNTP